MNFLRRLASIFNPPAGAGGRQVYAVDVRCDRCGEVIRAEVNLMNDLSLEYAEGQGDATTYVCRKLLVGRQRCFQQVEVNLRFDANRQLIERHVSGGAFVI
jgi:hypothetical protein